MNTEKRENVFFWKQEKRSLKHAANHDPLKSIKNTLKNIAKIQVLASKYPIVIPRKQTQHVGVNSTCLYT